MSPRLRVVTGQLSHETNTFSAIPADHRAFEVRGVYRGQELITSFQGTATALGGIIGAARELDFELVPTVAASAHPSGPVVREVFEGFKGELLQGLEAAEAQGGVNGVLLSLHGAMVVEGIPDGEGALLREVRDKVGADVPVVATLDFHSNLTEEMLEYADMLVGYNTYPHVDMADRGQEAADILARIVRAGLKPVSFLSKPRLLPSLVAQKTDVGPFKKLYNKAYEAEENPDIVDVSVYGGFPYADIEPAGMGIIVTTDADSELAESTAKELEEYAYSIKEEMLVSLPSPDEAVERALAHDERPVVIADVADNPGAGGSCDETALLRALLNQEANGAAIFLADPEAVSAAFAAGVGSTTELSLGGKYSEDGERTLEVSAYVRLLSDGEFVYKGPQSKGLAGRLGKTAVLMIDDVAVVVGEHRVQTRDPEIFRFVGIEPNDCRVVVLKSSVHYRAAFKPLAAEIIEAAGPGAAPPELGLHTYNNLRRPIFPLDRE